MGGKKGGRRAPYPPLRIRRLYNGGLVALYTLVEKEVPTGNKEKKSVFNFSFLANLRFAFVGRKSRNSGKKRAKRETFLPQIENEKENFPL